MERKSTSISEIQDGMKRLEDGLDKIKKGISCLDECFERLDQIDSMDLDELTAFENEINQMQIYEC